MFAEVGAVGPEGKSFLRCRDRCGRGAAAKASELTGNGVVLRVLPWLGWGVLSGHLKSLPTL